MKKLTNLSQVGFYTMLKLLFVAVMFASCDKNNEEDIIGPDTKYSYIEPCLEWNSSPDEVRSYMTKEGWLFLEGSDKSAMYSNTKKNATISYTFVPIGTAKGLRHSIVTYLYSSDKAKLSLISDLERRHNVTLTKDEEKKLNTGLLETYSGVVLNGACRYTIILLVQSGTVNAMSVSYSLNF